MILVEPTFLACVGAFLGVVLLTLLPLWRRRQRAEVPGELIRRRLTVAALATVLLIVLASLVFLVESEDPILYFGGIAFVALMWAAVAWTVRRREALGRVLLRMPHAARQWILLGSGVMYFAMAAVLVFRSDWSVVAPMCLTLGSLLVVASHPLELREGGIASTEDEWRWSRVTHHAWVGEDHSVLEIRVRTRWLPCKPGFIRVPADRRERVAELLATYAAPQLHAEQTAPAAE